MTTDTAQAAPNPFNTELARRVLAAIDAEPRRWDQSVYCRKDEACGTAMCFAGWTVALSGIPLDPGTVWTIWTTGPDANPVQDNIPDAATRLLGLADHELEHYAVRLFAAGNSREMLGQYVDFLAAPQTWQQLADEAYSHKYWEIDPPEEDQDEDQEEDDPNPQLDV